MCEDVIILGGGISGLAAGWSLKKNANLSFQILEKSDRAGGWIQTTFQDGFLFEQGPRSCRPKGAGLATIQLAEELNLEMIPGKGTKRYLYTNQKLRPFPFFSPLIKLILKDLFLKKTQLSDETIYSYFSRKLGPNLTEQLIDPMALGIYAGNIKKLSMKSCFPSLYTEGSLIRHLLKNRSRNTHPLQKYPLFTFRNGMETLTKTLAQKLSSHIHYNAEVVNIDFDPKDIAIKLSNGKILKSRHVICTLPSSILYKLIPQIPEIPSNSITVVNIGYRKKVLEKEGFGYLVPSKEKDSIFGVVWDSSAFPEQNQHPEETRLTVMMPPNDEKVALDALKRHLNITEKPDIILVKTAHKAIPQYHVGHQKKIIEIESKLPKNFTLLGNSYHGVAVNDCIANATESSTLLQYL